MRRRARELPSGARLRDSHGRRGMGASPRRRALRVLGSGGTISPRAAPARSRPRDRERRGAPDRPVGESLLLRRRSVLAAGRLRRLGRLQPRRSRGLPSEWATSGASSPHSPPSASTSGCAAAMPLPARGSSSAWTRAGKIRDELATAAALTNLASAVSKLGEHDLARTARRSARGIPGDREPQQRRVGAEQPGRRRPRPEGARRSAAALPGALEGSPGRDRWGKARACADLGELACGTQDFAAARAWLEESLALFTALRHRRGILNVLESFAGLAAAEGHTERALTLAGAVGALRAAPEVSGAAARGATFRQSIESAWRAHDPQRPSASSGRRPAEPRAGCRPRARRRPAARGISYAKLTGSSNCRTAAMRSSGKPPSLACSRISDSSGA